MYQDLKRPSTKRREIYMSKILFFLLKSMYLSIWSIFSQTLKKIKCYLCFLLRKNVNSRCNKSFKTSTKKRTSTGIENISINKLITIVRFFFFASCFFFVKTKKIVIYFFQLTRLPHGHAVC